jgi:glutathione S-transferase
MITLHHLNNSRSQRIIWLLEELELPYELVKYQRGNPVPLAPPELKQVHPLGKSPVIVDGDIVIAESGAIVEYIIDTYGKGRLRPAAATPDYWRYIEWLHYAEGSAMLPLMLGMYSGMLGDAAAPLRPRIESETANNFAYMNDALAKTGFFVGAGLTGADIQILFVLEAAAGSGALAAYPHLASFVERMQARPAYIRGVEKGGPYQLMRR